MAYCRKLPLQKITKDPDILLRIEDLVTRTNHIVRETYQFIRLYFLHLLEINQVLPVINRQLIKFIFSLTSIQTSKGRESGLDDTIKTSIVTFYNEKYAPLHIRKVKAVGKDILNEEIVSMVTNIENHIKGSFFTYINRLVYSLSPENKDQRKLLRNDLFDRTYTSDDVFHEHIDTFSPLIQTAKTTFLYSNPQLCIPLLYRISLIVKNKGKKQLAILPLRRSLIPSHITIHKTIFVEAFRDILKKKKVDIWNNIICEIQNEVKTKEGFSFTSLKTDGVSCSLIFTVEKKTKKNRDKNVEMYFEDLQTHSNFIGKKLVAIDPNKGNLVYCYDGENTLRYTQNERRFCSRKTKYKKIIKSKENDVAVRMTFDSDFHTVKEDIEDMMQYNSRSCSSVEFMKYIEFKNKFSSRFSMLYEDTLFRKLRFNSKINLKRSEDLFVNRFKGMYGSDAVIIFGDWEERPGFLRGKEPSKGASLRHMFRRAGFEVYLLDEFRTSKLCYSCGNENDCNVIKRKSSRFWKQGEERVWGLLRCKNEHCRRIHNRDFNSASNILTIAKCVVVEGMRPLRFQRKTIQAVALSDEGGLDSQLNTVT